MRRAEFDPSALDDLAYLPHTVQLVFGTPGVTTVRPDIRRWRAC